MDAPRVLVLDDDPALLESLGAALCPPYAVLPAATAQAALALLDRSPVDVVLLDLCLGGEDGAGLVPEIRRRTAAPILLMTGYGTHANLLKSIQARPDDFLEKPFTLPDLLARLAALLARAAPAPDRLEAVRRRIEREYTRRLTLALLARQAGMSGRELRTTFLRRFGTTPHAYLLACRMRRATTLLDGTRGIKQVAVEVGYHNASNFSAAFKRLHGLSPSAFCAEIQRQGERTQCTRRTPL